MYPYLCCLVCVCVCVYVCVREVLSMYGVCVCVCLIQHIGYSSMLQWTQVCREKVPLCVCVCVCVLLWLNCLLFFLFMSRI